jgi:hypothetical protein
MRSEQTRALIERWRADAAGTYRTWFLWEERLKNFRSIRRGIAAVVAQIESGAFGTAYKGSSLETVVGSIAEQRQIFKGADHAFLWKPKLRIPDIYEDRETSSRSRGFSTRAPAATGRSSSCPRSGDWTSAGSRVSAPPPRTSSTSSIRRSRSRSTPRSSTGTTRSREPG